MTANAWMTGIDCVGFDGFDRVDDDCRNVVHAEADVK